MAARRARQIVSALSDDSAYKAAVAESDKILVVIDVHQSWCGPCTVMESIYRKVYLELDKAEDRVKFYTMDESKMTPEQKQGLPLHGCKPLFIVFKQRVMLAKIPGVNAPELESAVFDNVPALTDQE